MIPLLSSWEVHCHVKPATISAQRTMESPKPGVNQRSRGTGERAAAHQSRSSCESAERPSLAQSSNPTPNEDLPYGSWLLVRQQLCSRGPSRRAPVAALPRQSPVLQRKAGDQRSIPEGLHGAETHCGHGDDRRLIPPDQLRRANRSTRRGSGLAPHHRHADADASRPRNPCSRKGFHGDNGFLRVFPAGPGEQSLASRTGSPGGYGAPRPSATA
ncbi:hypothetical protein SKAU_G00322470 [Synaphobranchus kaupii]|uniref:Uncharacterized protein n=1 Tax=Synaphobranchus kaupii TaxID=118154 RepID=A0A9Q1EP11_SYNKA|nr:hypothetical protein SKAU_G00322470 [Synaphobranchus kaupii]